MQECAGEGFVVPDDVIDAVHEITPLGLWVYCLMGRARTRADYPTVESLSAATGKRTTAVWEVVCKLNRMGVLNEADVERLMETAGGGEADE